MCICKPYFIPTKHILYATLYYTIIDFTTVISPSPSTNPLYQCINYSILNTG